MLPLREAVSYRRSIFHDHHQGEEGFQKVRVIPHGDVLRLWQGASLALIHIATTQNQIAET